MKIKLFLLSLIALSGCAKTEYGPTLTEPAEIYDTCFVPAGHGMTSGGYGLGFDGKGHYTAPQSVHIPAAYAVVFKCQHGKFIIDGQRGATLYHKFYKGDQVTVLYCEVFSISKSVTNITGLHFIGAEKSKE